VTVKGTSSLHEWESVVEKLDCKATFGIDGNNLVEIKDVTVQVPVKSIKSSHGKMMDNKTFDAFTYEKYPFIVFTLSSDRINASGSTAELKGSLAMAGTTKQIDIAIACKLLPNGDLQMSGSKKIKMTEFRMEPPTAMMGTIKVGDEVTITFDIVLSSTNGI
jgi:polyisoprenoid-binding protein YceI